MLATRSTRPLAAAVQIPAHQCRNSTTLRQAIMATKLHRIMSTEGLTPFLLSLPKLKHIIAHSFLNTGRAFLLRILLTDGHKVNHNFYPTPIHRTQYPCSTPSPDRQQRTLCRVPNESTMDTSAVFCIIPRNRSIF